MMKAVKILLALAVGMLAAPARAETPRAFTKGSLEAIVAAKHGTPTIVHFWGLTCGPCRGDMPDWAALLKAHPQAAFVTVDTDNVPDPRDQANRLWQDAGVPRREAWRFDRSAPEELYFDVAHDWQGEIPLTLLIARDGRTETFTGALDDARVERWLAAQDTK